MDVRKRQEQRGETTASAGVGIVGLEVTDAMTYGSERSRSGRRGKRGLGIRLRKTWLLIIFSVVFCLSVLQWLISVPPPLHKRPPANACSVTTGSNTPYILQDDAVCSKACGGQCFPRVRGICIAHSLVTNCETERQRKISVPSQLRFAGADPLTRRRVDVIRGTCPSQEKAVWIKGTQMIADMKMMPSGPHVGPNPHHEAEKLIPAILLSHLYGLNQSSLYWFTSPVAQVVSRWSLGMIEAFSGGLDVKFLDVPDPGEPEICFEDAILFSGVTNAGYMPNVAANDWLRRNVLAHCKIPEMRAKRPVSDVVVLRRNNSSRTIANVEEVERVLERELGVPVKHTTGGLGNFCEQARLAAEADFFVTPHGSHNINFLFARPDSVILEAFPLLYYIDWFHNYVHAARVNHYELYGTWPTEQGGMPLRMRLYSVLVGWGNCFSVRQCMNYSKNQKIFMDIDQLEWLLRALTTSCRVVVKGSWCLSAGGAQDTALVL